MNSQTQSVAVKTVAVLLLAGLYPLASWPQSPAASAASRANAPSTVNWRTTVRGKHLTVRVNPQSNPSLYKTITVGSVAYTGPWKKLKPREVGQLVALLQESLAEDLSGARLSSDSSATGSLTLNASIIKVKRSHPVINAVTIAAVFVPLDLGEANVTSWVVDEKTGQAIAEIETVGCGQIYQVIGGLQALGQSKLALKKQSRSIAKEVQRLFENQKPVNLTAAVLSANQ